MIRKLLSIIASGMVISLSFAPLFGMNPYAPSAPSYEMLNAHLEPSAPVDATFTLQFYVNDSLGQKVKFHLANPEDNAMAIAHAESLIGFCGDMPTLRQEINNAIALWQNYQQNVRVEMHSNNNDSYAVKIFIGGDLWKVISFDPTPTAPVPPQPSLYQDSSTGTWLKAVSIVAVIGITAWAGKKIFKAVK